MIQAEHLTKDYGSRRVVNDVSFHLGEKEILGFLGNYSLVPSGLTTSSLAM